MKLNHKLNHKRKQESKGTVDLTKHVDVDKETQRLKWRIYKQRYRQKMRKNAANKKLDLSNQKRKIKEKKSGDSKSRLANKTEEKVSARNLECKSVHQEPVKNRRVQIETKKETNKTPNTKIYKTVDEKVTRAKTKTKISEIRKTTNEEVTRESMREKWRQYKRNYRQKMRNKVLLPANHSPKIVEEGTAIYFVEENINSDEYIFENDFSEEEQEYEFKSENSLSTNIEQSFEELITIKCEPSDIIECVLRPAHPKDN